MLVFKNQIIDTDENGYLKNSADWSIDLAALLAEKEGIILTESHWEIILFIRDFYNQYNTSPSIRLLVTTLKKKLVMIKGIVIICIVYFLMGQRNKQVK